MKHILMTSLLILGLFVQGFSQRGEIKGKVAELRKEFFETELQLTPAEADNFWPLFDKMKEEQKVLDQEYKVDTKLELLSDADVEAYIMKRFELEEKQIDLKRKYFTLYKEAIPIRKIALLPKVEMRFKKELLRRIRRHQKDNMMNRRGN